MTLLVVAGAVAAIALAWWVSQLGNRGPGDARLPNPSGGTSAIAPPSEAGVRSLLAAGDKIGAIKQYRELTGLGLKEAKDAVDAMEAGRVLPVPAAPAKAPGLDPALDPEIRRLVDAGELIEAIKRYRTLTGAGLKEAKDAIEGLTK
jgi:ribosomal protein L7/L12